jgi:hypothetical protein
MDLAENGFTRKMDSPEKNGFGSHNLTNFVLTNIPYINQGSLTEVEGSVHLTSLY